MSNLKFKTFNMEVCRPQVLLLGNGLTYSDGVPWYKLIEEVARDKTIVDKYKKYDPDGNHIGFHVPNTVLTLATSEKDDQQRHKKYGKAFENIQYNTKTTIKNLMKIPFDAILSTNYTYELEAALFPDYPTLSTKSQRKYAFQTINKRDSKYLLHTYNRIKEMDIWHIHGELRRPGSIILSHDEYARMVHKILSYNAERGADYEVLKEKLDFRSWIDYFLMGDVYILGLTLDYSDFDLWWLLGRRLRENAQCGSIIFYEAKKEDAIYKQMALEDSNVNIETCGCTITSGSDYDKFYDLAIQDIQKKIEAKLLNK